MRLGLLASLLACCACSAVDREYAWRGYDVKAPGAIKRIAVGAWAPPDQTEVATLAAHIATDLIKLRKNYLVHEPASLTRSFTEACGELEGVVAFVVHDLEKKGDTVDAAMEANLQDCKSGRLVWRAEGHTNVDSNDPDLTNLASTYTREVGEVAKPYAAPLFALIQDLIQGLPDPLLSEDEVLEKIELGTNDSTELPFHASIESHALP